MKYKDKMLEDGIKQMKLVDWWQAYGMYYEIPYDAAVVNKSILQLWVEDDAFAISSLKLYLQNSNYQYSEMFDSAYALSKRTDNAETVEARAWRKEEKRGNENTRGEKYTVDEAREVESAYVGKAIKNIVEGKTSLQPVDAALPMFFDITDFVEEGSRPIEGKPPERKLGWTGGTLVEDMEKRANGSYYRIYNEETGQIDYYSGKEIRDNGGLLTAEKTISEKGLVPKFSVNPEMSNREAFFREVLPDDEPKNIVKRYGAHYGWTYYRGDWEQKWMDPRTVYESRDERAMHFDYSMSPVKLVAQMRASGYILRIDGSDRVILCAALDEDGFPVYGDEMMKLFSKKKDSITGLTYKQIAYMYLTCGDYTSKALAGKNYDLEEVLARGKHLFETTGNVINSSGSPYKMLKIEVPEEDTSKDKTYWEMREACNEQKWLDITENTAGLQDKMLTRCCNEVIDKLNKFYESIEAGHVPTRGELLRNEQYRQTILAIQSKLSSEGQQNLTVIKGSMEQIVKTVNLSVLTKGMINATVNTEYKGENYSSRVWNNTRTLATRLESTIEDCIIAGRNIQEATTKIKHEFSVARYQAERLLRTETARVYTRATEDSFASAGIDEVKILVERGACEECAKLKGKTWKRGEQPTLPVHPNCRCALAPVVKARYTRKEK